MGIRMILLAAILSVSTITTATSTTAVSTIKPGLSGTNEGMHSKDKRNDEMKKECLEDLRHILGHQDEWIKVHAAEFLLQLGYPEGVKEAFIKENQLFSKKSPYRIGIWRVLAQSEQREREKQLWVIKITNAFLDPQGSDRLHAIETLAKLKTSLQRKYPVQVEEALNSAAVPMALYSKWSTAYTDKHSLASVRTQFIEGLLSADLDDPEQAGAIRLSSYVLRFLGAPEQREWEALATLSNDHKESPVRSTLLTTLYLIHPSSVGERLLKAIKEELNENASKGVHVSDLMRIVAEKGRKEDVSTMQELFDKKRDTAAMDYDADVHATAAFSFARLLTRMENTTP